MKQFQPALQAFQKAVALDPKYLKARYNMGVTYDRLGQMKYAEFIYRILIRDFPEFALAYDSLAVSLSKSGRAREAVTFHERAISLAAADPSFYFNYSLTCLMLGDVKRAARAATETARAGSGNGRAPRHHDREASSVTGHKKGTKSTKGQNGDLYFCAFCAFSWLMFCRQKLP
jgi:superkiller protein 3